MENVFDFIDTRDLFVTVEPLARSYKPTERGSSLLSKLYCECTTAQQSILSNLAPHAVSIAKQNLE